MVKYNHFNFCVQDMDRSLAFYEEALGLKPIKEAIDPDGAYKRIYLGDGVSDIITLELKWLRDHPQPYDIGEGQFHLAVTAENHDELRAKHREMGCIVAEKITVYFIQDPDGYQTEIMPAT